jgi:hypothetical protein
MSKTAAVEITSRSRVIADPLVGGPNDIGGPASLLGPPG